MRIDVPPFEQLFGAFRVLPPDAVAQIHQGALQTLESVGVRFDEPLARRCLQKAGATVEGDLVRFPGELIEEALKRRAETVVLGAKVERADLELGDIDFSPQTASGRHGSSTRSRGNRATLLLRISHDLHALPTLLKKSAIVSIRQRPQIYRRAC